MTFKSVRLRIKELASALDKDVEDIIAVCILNNIPATSPLTSLTIDQCKVITDYYEASND